MISRRKEDEGEIGEELEMGGQLGEIPSATRVAVEIKAESASQIVPGIIDSQQITGKTPPNFATSATSLLLLTICPKQLNPNSKRYVVLMSPS